MPPWDLLDFPVLVPAGEVGTSFHFHSCGWGVDRLHPRGAFRQVAVAVGADVDATPGWVVSTQPRRGIRPVDPDDGDGMDHLTVDPDLQTLAGQAVAELLLSTIRQDLPGRELAALAELEDEQSRAIGAELQLRPTPDDPWRREVLQVDGGAFALWVHRQARGWAGVADLGAVVVTLHGRAQPSGWELATASSQEVSALFAAARHDSRGAERSIDGDDGQGGEECGPGERDRLSR